VNVHFVDIGGIVIFFLFFLLEP